MVRFEGVAGEFAQFDFGVADVRLLDGRAKRIHFAAYRLKHSRWVWVVVVTDERVESLVRALLASFEHPDGEYILFITDCNGAGTSTLYRMDAEAQVATEFAGEVSKLSPGEAPAWGPIPAAPQSSAASRSS